MKPAIGDADLLIVQTALNIAKENTVTVIGENTDFLILLLYHKLTKSMPVYLTGEEKSNMKSKPKIWDMQYAKEKLGDDLCNSLLAVHALLGCDTTSRIHSVGKATAFQKFKANAEFRLLIKTLSSDSGTKADILAAGERLLLMLTGDVREKTLDELRYSQYTKKLGTAKKALSPKMFGPTSDAASLHLMCAYYQIQAWKGRTDLELSELGWMLKNDFTLPVPMTKALGPSNILKVIRCSCQGDCTGRCTCHYLGIKCTSICSTCRRVSCSNCDESPDNYENSDENVD